MKRVYLIPKVEKIHLDRSLMQNDYSALPPGGPGDSDINEDYGM